MKKKLQTKFYKIVSEHAPNVALKLAYKRLTNPQVAEVDARQKEVLDVAEKEVLDFKSFKIQTYFWKRGPRVILLVHGWESHAGSFATLIPALLDQEFSVYAFDGPSHGDSSKGATDLFDFSALVHLLLVKKNITEVVGHSFGAVAVTYALYNHPKLQISNFVLLSTPDNFTKPIQHMLGNMGVPPQVITRLIQKIEEQSKLHVSKLMVSNLMKRIHVKNALIMHDKNDAVVPLQNALNVHQNVKKSTFFEVEGTGHFKIVQAPQVINKVVDYLHFNSL